MKKLFALSLALVMTLSLAACGGKKTEVPADTKTETETETPTTGDVKVAVVLKTLASEYWGYVETGCKACPLRIWVLTWSWLAPALRAISRVRFP